MALPTKHATQTLKHAPPSAQKKRYQFKPFVPTKSEILECTCGNKYIKTRKDQVLCFRCINKVR